MADKIVIERQSAATAMNNINMLEKKKKEDHIRVKFVNQVLFFPLSSSASTLSLSLSLSLACFTISNLTLKFVFDFVLPTINNMQK